MSSQMRGRSDFTETMAVHLALKSALKGRQFSKHQAVQKAATKLCKSLEGERSIYGRQLKMISMMERGVSLSEVGRKLRCSRRTIFRYLNYLEDAGVPIKLADGKYRVDKTVAKMLRS